MQESFVLSVISAALRRKCRVHHREGSCSSQYGYCVGHRYGGVPVKMFANAPILAHVIVATLDDRVDVRDKVEI